MTSTGWGPAAGGSEEPAPLWQEEESVPHWDGDDSYDPAGETAYFDPAQDEPVEYPDPDRPRRTPLIAIAVVALLLVGGVGAWAALRGPGEHPASQASTASPSPSPAPTVSAGEAAGRRYLNAWELSDWATMQSLVLDPTDDVGGVYRRLAGRLQVEGVQVVPGSYDPTTGTLPFTATLTVGDLGAFTYAGAVQLVEAAVTGETATAGGTGGPTGSASPDASGWKVKFTSATVHPALSNGQRLGLISAADADPARSAVLDRTGKPLAADADLAANVLGTPASGTSAGSGLLRVLKAQLGGKPGAQVVLADATSGATLQVLKDFPGKPAAAVRTTLDLGYQRAAEKALARVPSGRKAAVVAIDPRTGAVLALANKEIAGVPTSQNGVYPPGSTFKVITAMAGLEHGLTPSSRVACPAKLSVVGKVFTNHEKPRSESLTLTQAFAQSCNTAFIGVARDLPAGALQETARRFGFTAAPGESDLLPIAAARGSIPDTPDAVDLAASAIGQGEVQATPLHMASIAAGVASGTWRQPHLLASCPTCASSSVPEAAAMRTLMRAVVISGTASAMGSVSGGPVYAKTGTPEWGAGDPPATHAWVIGWQGHTAFAVFVERGSSGAEAAVPVAKAFLKALPRSH